MILFLDNTYPQPYQVSTLTEQALGGTESSIIKTAVILSSRYKVIVAQKFRTKEHIESPSLRFIPKQEMYNLTPHFIIVLRKYPLLKHLKLQFPQAKLYLWLHTYKNIEYILKRPGLGKTNTTIICNSSTHKNATNKLLNTSSLGKLLSLFCNKVQVAYCYNPVTAPLKLNNIRDKNKLLFFSSPNKGLAQILTTFNLVNKTLPNLTLYIANPGYKQDSNVRQNQNIKILGSLPHNEMMQHVSAALCVFYPQDSFAETFGLIYAEANAYGTPVLAHDLGAAKEILDTNNPLIDANNTQQIITILKQWQKKYPKISYNQKFSDMQILAQWHSLFELRRYM
ncbi:MAG: glycosyltransferase [Proteobacteria bacterium]|nr:glycosyltransferase [Pseudomonadota bacterium]